MRILGVSGSLRTESTNTRLLAAAAQLVPAGVEMHITTWVAGLPLFSPDLDPEHSEAVGHWMREVRTADGIVISTPEYARGYPGALKNAFDWLVGSDAYVDKPFMMLNATSRSTVAHETFARVLETMSGIPVAGASTMIPLLGTRQTVAEIVGNPEFAARIRRSMEAFVAALERRALGADT